MVVGVVGGEEATDYGLRCLNLKIEFRQIAK